MTIDRFPKCEVGHLFNPFVGKIMNECKIKHNKIAISYPCRLDAMAINPAAVCYNDSMFFTPGEVVISTNIFVKVQINVLSSSDGILKISEKTKRKVLVKHSYLLMCKALNISPSLEIIVEDQPIPKHCGFGSSSSIIAAVASAINELYGMPISNEDLIKYLASNHAEEISDDNEDFLKVVQCIGGGATNGLTDAGIMVIAGKATTISSLKYNSDVLIALPKNFVQKNAEELMNLEEENLWKFKITGEKYSKDIAYDILHKVLPDMKNGNIFELAQVVFDYRFNMGSIENCSFVYENMVDLASKIRVLYEEHKCQFLSLSSVGPAYFLLVNNQEDKEYCRNFLEKLDMNIIETSICNSTYIVNNIDDDIFWKRSDTIELFAKMIPSKYITCEIDKILNKNDMVLDIGCGSGRYSKYISSVGGNVFAIDKYPEMAKNEYMKNIYFLKSDMDNLPFKDKMFNLILSIGVWHNAKSHQELEKSIKEAYRVLKKQGYCIMSIFTNDIITDDLIACQNDLYLIKDREPMVLLSKNNIKNIIEECEFKIVKIIDEHITDVGTGKRNVYSLLLQKEINKNDSV